MIDYGGCLFEIPVKICIVGMLLTMPYDEVLKKIFSVEVKFHYRNAKLLASGVIKIWRVKDRL